MAHLTYAIAQGDGFVEIIGEVGTGKTTLCRVFLENLKKDTEAAYIFNPKIEPIQLLKAINDEFGISSAADNNKDLIDTVNTFLMEKMAEGKNVILLIDEAQNLTKDILELIRLLSNLETNRHKLLQIILVGQPEFRDILESHELRQLGQRITLRCHLMPFSYRETRDYIQHRIHIASRKPVIKFTPWAYRTIYNYSRGIPRLINIVCDRALLTAFSLNQQKINAKVARIAVRELADRRYLKRFRINQWLKAGTLGLLLCFSVFMVFLFGSGGLKFKSPPLFSRNEQTARSTASNQVGNPEVSRHTFELKSSADLFEFLKKTDARTSRNLALVSAMSSWGDRFEITPALNSLEDDHDFFLYTADRNGLRIHKMECEFSLLKKINLPAIISIPMPDEQSIRYLSILKIKSEKILLNGEKPGAFVEINADIINDNRLLTTYIPWKNFLGYKGTIPITAPSESIIMLKMHMQDIGFEEIEINSNYDQNTILAVKEVQKKYGLKVDGIVGPLTKMALYNEKKSLNIPHITTN